MTAIIDLAGPPWPCLPVPADRVDAFRNLTKQQSAITNHLAGGLSNKEIAARLNLSPSTVKTHVLAIYQRTCFRNRIELAVNWLIFTGVVQRTAVAQR